MIEYDKSLLEIIWIIRIGRPFGQPGMVVFSFGKDTNNLKRPTFCKENDLVGQFVVANHLDHPDGPAFCKEDILIS